MNMDNQNNMEQHEMGLPYEVFKCGACRTVFDIRVGVVLTECHHTFCKQCIRNLFEHALDGIFKCLCLKTGDKNCQKYVMMSTIKEIYNIDDYYSQIIGSVAVEERKTEEVRPIQNEQSTNDERDSTSENEESTSKKVPTAQNEDSQSKELDFKGENEEPETSKSNAEDDEVLKYKCKENEEPMSHEPNNYQDATQCRNPECKVWLYYGKIHYSKKFFTCPDCEQKNCFLCKGLHNPEAINCAEYKQTLKNTSEHSEELLKKMLENKEAMLCLNCKEILLKDDGCDFITCLWCKVELCWVTQNFRWGAWGPGDTSGGCRCRVDGIKCHPDCRGCH